MSLRAQHIVLGVILVAAGLLVPRPLAEAAERAKPAARRSEADRELVADEFERAHWAAVEARAAAEAAKRDLDNYVARRLDDERRQSEEPEAAEPAGPAEVEVLPEPEVAESIKQLTSEIAKLKNDRDQLLTRMTPAHPQVVELETRIATLSKRLTAVRKAAGLPTPKTTKTRSTRNKELKAEQTKARKARERQSALEFREALERWRAAERSFEQAVEAEASAKERLSAPGTREPATSPEEPDHSDEAPPVDVAGPRGATPPVNRSEVHTSDGPHEFAPADQANAPDDEPAEPPVNASEPPASPDLPPVAREEPAGEPEAPSIEPEGPTTAAESEPIPADSSPQADVPAASEPAWEAASPRRVPRESNPLRRDPSAASEPQPTADPLPQEEYAEPHDESFDEAPIATAVPHAVEAPIEPPTSESPPPGPTSHPLALAAFVVAGVIAVLACIGLARSSRNTAFTDVNDVSATLALPVVGVIPLAAAAPAGHSIARRGARLFAQLVLAAVVFAAVAYTVATPGLLEQICSKPIELLRR